MRLLFIQPEFENIGVEPTVMKAAWKKNLEVRKEYDWKDIKGAVNKRERKNG